MFKKLIYVIRTSRQRAIAKRQPLVIQVRNTYGLLDPYLLHDIHKQTSKTDRFTMPVKNVEELIKSLYIIIDRTPLVIKASNIPNGNFEVNIGSFLVTSEGYYTDIYSTTFQLKKLVKILTDYLLTVADDKVGAGETNTRLTRHLLTQLLALGLVLHDVTMELL